MDTIQLHLTNDTDHIEQIIRVCVVINVCFNHKRESYLHAKLLGKLFTRVKNVIGKIMFNVRLKMLMNLYETLFVSNEPSYLLSFCSKIYIWSLTVNVYCYYLWAMDF